MRGTRWLVWHMDETRFLMDKKPILLPGSTLLFRFVHDEFVNYGRSSTCIWLNCADVDYPAKNHLSAM